jgi:O-antigen/teichoic acid export membrane protein
MNRTGRYISNVLWNTGGVAVLLLVGFIMSPFVLRHVGDKKYGEWTLVLSLVEYYWLIDLGFRSATIKFSAEFNALKDRDQLGELLSTAVVYASLAGAAVILASLLVAEPVAAAWHVGQPEFPALLRIVSVSWAVGMVFNVFGGCLEGFQRFDILNRVWITNTVLRSAGVIAVLKLGYSVMAMGWVLFGTQMISYLAFWLAYRSVARAPISFRAGTRTMLRRMAGYGAHTLTAQVAQRLLNYSVPAVIGYLLPIEYVAYWAIPVKMMDYAFDGIGRIGMVTTPASAEFAARGERDRLRELGVHSNRYCMALFVPFAVFLLVYGNQAYTLWLRRPDFVARSGFLLPILLIGYAVTAGQFNSASILFGLGRQKVYVRCLLAEAILSIAGLAIVLPRFGLAGAAWVITILMTLDRGVVVAALFSREVAVHPFAYAVQIYARPVALGSGMALILWLLKTSWLPGENWLQVGGAVAIASALYVTLAGVFVLTPYHREQLLLKVAPWVGRAAEEGRTSRISS